MFEKGKRGSEKLFPLFPFSNLFYLFLKVFYFIKCKGEQKQICSGKGEKKMVNLGGGGVRKKIQMQMVQEGWKRKWDNYWFTSQREFHVYSSRVRLSPYL
jgi:hypothetical protein